LPEVSGCSRRGVARAILGSEHKERLELSRLEQVKKTHSLARNDNNGQLSAN
jgi:hypothetical protein